MEFVRNGRFSPFTFINLNAHYKTINMKKKFTLVLSALLVSGLIYDFNFRMAHTNSSGSPAGNTGSPSDGQSCARSGCHSGPSVSNEDIDVSADIPASGYIGGETYNISFTMTKPGGVKFGFQLSPQDNAGNGLGTLIAGTGSQIVSSKYITHTFNGTSASGGTKTWDFQWIAPVAGTGSVDVYYAGNFTNSASGALGDVVVTGSLTVNEATVGISEAELVELSVYPNPVIDEINIAAVDVDEEIMVTMFSIEGRKVLEETYEGGDVKIDLRGKSLNSGVYFLNIEVDGKSTVKKLLVK